jgi:hypothetical protein
MICNELLINNKTIDFAYTYFTAVPNEPIDNIYSEHVLVIKNKLWKIRNDKQRMTVEGKDDTFNSEAIGYGYSDTVKEAVTLLDVNRKNLVMSRILVYFIVSL